MYQISMSVPRLPMSPLVGDVGLMEDIELAGRSLLALSFKV